MTAHRDLKRIVRARQKKTGESYTAARVHVMRDRAVRLGRDEVVPSRTDSNRVDAVVLKVNQQSARVRILAEDGQVTFRTSDVRGIVPGHLVTVVIENRWTWRDDAYACGAIEDPRIEVEKIGLEPLPLQGGSLDDLREGREPYEDPDPYAPRWRELTATPRARFEMDAIAWGSFPGETLDENPTCDAAELADVGDWDGARRRSMDALCTDLRCLDAHAMLGHIEFESAPELAIRHFEVGVRIGELSFPPDFDGVIEWGRIYNRPFLRCLLGYGRCLRRLGEVLEAREVFERILALNPNDDLGVRFCWQDACETRTREPARD